jgi:hypothetical protein
MKKICGSLLFFFLITAVTFPAMAENGAASVLMPVKVRIVRCVTDEERINMCQSENLCCNLPVAGQISQQDGERDYTNTAPRSSDADPVSRHSRLDAGS